MTERVLSEDEQKFLDALFDTKGHIGNAAEVLGWPASRGYAVVRKLRAEIIEQAEYILALYGPRASFTLAEGVEGDAPLSPTKIEAAKQILDRIGVVKKEKVEITGPENTPLFILPAKKDEPTS